MADDKKAVAMAAPDGEVYMIPHDQVSEAYLRGAKPAMRMSAPDGNQYWVPPDQVEDGLSHGGKLVQPSGSEYPKGTEPVVTGRNAAGQPIWGSSDGMAAAQGDNAGGFWDSAGNAISSAEKGIGNLLHPGPTPEEVAAGRTGTIHDLLRIPERLVDPVLEMGRRASGDLQRGDYSQAAGHELAASLPMVGPWAADVAEREGKQLGAGNYAGAAGTLLGNATVAGAGEAVPALAKAGGGALLRLPAELRDRFANAVAPTDKLNTPVSPGDLTPLERYDVAKGMGVNLDMAQATNTAGPRLAKRVTENSLGGKGKFEANNEANVKALHEHAAALQDGIAPPMGREQFGKLVQDRLQSHRDALVDEPGQVAAAKKVLDDITPKSMDRNEFGDAVREAMEKDRGRLRDTEEQLYSDLDSRHGGQAPDLSAVAQKARGIYDQNKRFYDNHPEMLKGGDARVWAIIQDFAGIDKDAAKTAPDTWADLQRARSHLLDLTRSPEFVGDLATSWAKQLTSVIDSTMTSAEKTPGLSAQDVDQFRQANALHKRSKTVYDDPKSPFYWIARQDGLKNAEKINGLTPTEAAEFRRIMGDVERPDLVSQQQRQTVSRMLDPSQNGAPDLGGLKSRWQKAQKEELGGILFPNQMDAVQSLANRTGETTQYDTKGSKLGQILDAPDGLAASRVMFTDNGQLRLTPQEVRYIQDAAPEVIPAMRRQAVSRLLDPSENGTPELRTLPSRWNRTQKENLSGLLPPETMKSLDDLSSVTQTVNLPSNPSQTAVVMQPVQEGSALVRGTMGALPSIVGSAFGAGIDGSAGALLGGTIGAGADTVAKSLTARALTNPDLVERVMGNGRTPQSAPAATPPPTPPTIEGGALKIATPMASDAAATSQDNNPQREGISTPPNEGQIASTTTAEPNEVHDPAVEAAKLKQVMPGSAPMSPSEPGDKGLSGAQIQTGTTASQAQAPEGATHEVVGSDGSVLGHVVNGEYVPLAQQ